MTGTQTHHRFDYIELAAPDLAAAQAFYAAAFGWEFNDYGGQYAGIRGAAPDTEVGGLDPAGTPGVGGVLAQVYSDDLEASLAAVTQAGGRISAEPFAFPGGRRFHFLDPAGNQLGVWSAKQA
ncbi:VOC family protein [Dermacoccaceae bacterium W4C1]